jgi:hypothetical protein
VEKPVQNFLTAGELDELFLNQRVLLHRYLLAC